MQAASKPNTIHASVPIDFRLGASGILHGGGGASVGCGVTGGAGDCTLSDRKSAPHSAQNRDPDSLLVPQLGQMITRDSELSAGFTGSGPRLPRRSLMNGRSADSSSSG